jgi:periplasmic divalent cation tolerance protein
MSQEYYIILNTCPDLVTAEAIANTLVDEELAACVNIIPGVRSVYLWEGQRTTSQEHLLLIKAMASDYETIEETILELHPYELPEIIAVSISAGLPDYLDWLGVEDVED